MDGLSYLFFKVLVVIFSKVRIRCFMISVLKSGINHFGKLAQEIPKLIYSGFQLFLFYIVLIT